MFIPFAKNNICTQPEAFILLLKELKLIELVFNGKILRTYQDILSFFSTNGHVIDVKTNKYTIL